MLNTFLKYFNYSTITPPKGLFPADFPAESAATFQATLRTEFDQALVNYLLAVKLSNNITIEKKLTPADRAYIHTYYTIYHSFQALNGLLVFAFARYINKNIELAMSLGFIICIAIINVNKHVSEFNLLQQRMLHYIYPSLEKNSENLKSGLENTHSTLSLLLPIIIAIALYFIDPASIGKEVVAFFGSFNLSKTCHDMFINLLTPLLTKNIIATPPTAVQTKDMRNAEREMSSQILDHYLPEDREFFRQSHEEELNRYRSAWQCNPDSFLSARYRLSIKINPNDDSANALLLPGYHGQAELNANRIYQQHETEGTLNNLRDEVNSSFSSLENVIEIALTSLSSQDKKIWHAYLTHEMGENASLSSMDDIVTKQLMLIFLSRCHQKSISMEDLQSPADFLYSIILFQHALLPVKERHTKFDEGLTHKVVFSNVVDIIGQNQMTRTTVFPQHLRYQTPTVSIEAHVDTEHFLNLVNTFSLFQPAEIDKTIASSLKKKL